MNKLDIYTAITFFRRSGIPLSKSASEEKIQQLEKILDFEFPEDFKKFHKIANGFENWEMDDNNFSIWDFDRMLEEWKGEKETDPDFIPIGDFLINSYWYGYIKGRSGIFKDYDRTKKIASNFEEFLNLLINNDDKMY